LSIWTELILFYDEPENEPQFGDGKDTFSSMIFICSSG
jgi:hypothetical protein